MKAKFQSKLIPAMVFAGMIGGIFILYTLIVDLANARFTTLNIIAMYVLQIAGLTYAMFSYRKDYRGNVINYGEAFAFGTLVAVFFSAIIVIFNFVYAKWINPDIVQMTRDFAEQRMLEKGVPEDMIEQQMKLTERINSPLITLIGGFIGNLLSFSVMNLIIAAILKREPADPFANIEEN